MLPQPKFKAKLESYGGIHKEVLNDPEAFAFFEPIIRADFQAVEQWPYFPRPKLAIPTTVLFGSEEGMTEKEILDWQREFSLTIQFESFPGGHFFLFERAEKFAATILKEIT